MTPPFRYTALCCAVATCLSSSAAAQTPAALAPDTTGRSSRPAPQQRIGDAGRGLDWLVGSTLHDMKRLPSSTSVTLLAVGAAGALLGGTAVDHPVSQSLASSRPAGRILGPGELIGGARFQLAGAVATYGIGRVSKSPRVTAIGGDLLRAQFLTQTLTAGIKMSVRRMRPDGSQFSFPSGHSAVTFASATVLHQHLGPKVGIPAYAVATYVAASRIQARRHYLSDVAYGAALGVLGGRTVTIGRGDVRFAVAPAPTPGGAGVAFSWLGTK